MAGHARGHVTRALSHARAGAQNQARTLLAEASGAHQLDDQVAAIVEAWPQLTPPLLDILTALEEDGAVQCLISRMSTRQPRKTAPSDDEDVAGLRGGG